MSQQTTRQEATITVDVYEPVPYDEPAEGPTLTRCAGVGDDRGRPPRLRRALDARRVRRRRAGPRNLRGDRAPGGGPDAAPGALRPPAVRRRRADRAAGQRLLLRAAVRAQPLLRARARPQRAPHRPRVAADDRRHHGRQPPGAPARRADRARPRDARGGGRDGGRLRGPAGQRVLDLVPGAAGAARLPGRGPRARRAADDRIAARKRRARALGHRGRHPDRDASDRQRPRGRRLRVAARPRNRRRPARVPGGVDRTPRGGGAQRAAAPPAPRAVTILSARATRRSRTAYRKASSYGPLLRDSPEPVFSRRDARSAPSERAPR